MNLWRIALRNLRRNRRRNLATAAAIALGYAGMALFGGYIWRIELFLRTTTVYLQHGGHVVVYRRGGLEKSLARPSRHSLTLDDQRRVTEAAGADPRVAFSARYLRGMGLAGNGCRTVPFVATGVERDVLRRILTHPDVLHVSPDFARPLRGRPLTDYPDLDGAVGLSAGLARLLGKPRVHDAVRGAPIAPIADCTSPAAVGQIASDANVQLAGLSFDGSISAIDGEIVNTFHAPTAETEDQTVLTSIETLQHLYVTDAVTYVALFLHDADDAHTVASQLQAHLRSQGVPVDVFSYDDERVNPYYVGSMAFLKSLLVFVGALITAVVILGILNSATLTAYERTREIGTFRALGYRRRHVTALFLREGLLIAMAGIAAGLVVAVVVASTVNAANIRFTPPGIPGSVQLVLWPTPRVYLGVALTLLPLASIVNVLVARRRVAEPTADLLTATPA